MTEKMVERVARAIMIGLKPDMERYRGSTNDYRRAARAAITVMLDPTQAMADAGVDASAIAKGRDCLDIWRAMIEAALD
jgi:hypothetical protein